MSEAAFACTVALGIAIGTLVEAVRAARLRHALDARLAGVGAAAVPAERRRMVDVVAERWQRRTSASRDADALPDVVDAIARAVRTGASPAAALSEAAATAPPSLGASLVAVVTAAGRGVPFVAAVDRWAAAGVDGAALVAAAVAVTSSAGGDPSRALTGVADTLRDRRALRREVRALSSQARLSALVLAVAPVVFAAMAAGIDTGTAAVLLGSPLGWACLVAGLALDLAGWSWMDRITRTLR